MKLAPACPAATGAEVVPIVAVPSKTVNVTEPSSTFMPPLVTLAVSTIVWSAGLKETVASLAMVVVEAEVTVKTLSTGCDTA